MTQPLVINRQQKVEDALARTRAPSLSLLCTRIFTICEDVESSIMVTRVAGDRVESLVFFSDSVVTVNLGAGIGDRFTASQIDEVLRCPGKRGPKRVLREILQALDRKNSGQRVGYDFHIEALAR